MGWDFSAFDAELQALWAGPVVDAQKLAHTYAGGFSNLSDIDAQLNQLDADGALERLAPAPRPLSRPPGARSRRSSAPARSAAPASGELVLPEPMEQGPVAAHDTSGELPLHGTPAGAARSGSFWLESQARVPGRDDTLEPFDDELVEADDVIEFTAASSHGEGRSSSPALPTTPASPRTQSSLFDKPPEFDGEPELDADAPVAADATFSELFAAATRKSSAPAPYNSSAPGPRYSSAPAPRNSSAPGSRNSSAPAPRNSSAPGPRESSGPERYSDDTETFDAKALAFVESGALQGDDHMGAEELDSAEFELMIESDGTSVPQPKPPTGGEPRAPQAGEKRPSFLGRLFGRKDD